MARILSKVILFGERSLRRALSHYVEHFHTERNHQGEGNVLLFPRDTHHSREGPVRCRERLGARVTPQRVCWLSSRIVFAMCDTLAAERAGHHNRGAPHAPSRRSFVSGASYHITLRCNNQAFACDGRRLARRCCSASPARRRASASASTGCVS